MILGETTTKQRYVDRVGRTISNAEDIQFRRAVQQLRRLNTLNGNAGRGWDSVTIGDITKAMKLSAERVAEMFDDGHLIVVGKTDGPASEWKVFEDGE